MAADDTVNGTAPSGATAAVLKPSDPVPEGATPVEGLDFNDFTNRNVTVAELVEKMGSMGFQASSIGRAAQIIDGMVGMKLQTFHGLCIRDS
jgi:deoxyhypusine synthase